MKKTLILQCFMLILIFILSNCQDDNDIDDKLIITKNYTTQDKYTERRDLGSILFIGNSHTFRAYLIENLAKENGYTLTTHHVTTAGWHPLGNDYASSQNPSFNENMMYPTNDHISNFLKREASKVIPTKPNWIIIQDGTVYNSLTSAGTLMGLASAFGAKVACYQSWDLSELSTYASAKFHLPMIPVGYAIPPEYKDLKYHIYDGHMSNKGAYVFAVSFLHFLTGIPIDDIKGDAGLPISNKVQKKAKKRIKDAYIRANKELDNIKNYYDILDTSKFTIEKSCKNIEFSQEIACSLRLSEPAIFKLPANRYSGKLQIDVKSEDPNIIGDIWFYNPTKKSFTAQGYNKNYDQDYTYIGKGDTWETDGSQILIVTRRGKTTTSGIYDSENQLFRDADGGQFSRIEESIDDSVKFTIAINII